MAAGLGLAVLVLSQSDTSKKPPTPKYTPTFASGSSLDFIKKMYPVALTAQKLYPKIPWQLFLSFSGLESGFGKHAPQYNFFGTKPGKGYTGQTQLLQTTEILPKATGYKFPAVIKIEPYKDGKYKWTVKDHFRAYSSPLEAYRDFGAFVSKGCYKKAENVPGVIQKLQQIKDCGYATDPGYVEKQKKLIALIEETVHRFL